MNNTGKLTTIAGPMYAGKTSAILQQILWIKHCNNSVLVLKPNLDNRYSEEFIETHNRLKFPCYAMQDWDDALDKYNFKAYNYNTVFIDKVQFLDTAKTLDNINKMLFDGVNVVAAGLDQDSRGEPFETTAMLLALSDDIQKIKAICTVCGKSATKTQRSEEASDKRVEVGSVGLYEPRCLEHWTPR